MKTNFTKLILLVGALALTTNHARAAEEQEVIATLQSATSAPQQWAACEKLRVIGTAKCVPALAALLGDERASQAARYVLEVLPGPEAGAALRDALGRTSGLTKAGIIDSLGWRREPEAVPLLVPLLSGADATIAAAAASSLGRIGGKEAIAALSTVRDQVPAAVQPTVLESLLKCAEQLLAAGDGPGAAALYGGLFDAKFPVQIRVAAWRGLALSDARRREILVIQALLGTDRPIQVAALKLVRELDDPQVIKACQNVSVWMALSAEAQLAVMDAQLHRGQALGTVLAVSRSPDPAVRTAAWAAMAELNDPATIPALAKAAATGDPAERDAARETLSRLHGPGMRDALLAEINSLMPAEEAELLRALGARGDKEAVDVLVKNAALGVEPVRSAALDSLRRLAVPATLAPLLDLAAKAKSEAECEPVLKALYAVCQASPDKEQTARRVIEVMNQLPAAERRQLLPLLAELGTSDALSSAQTATRDNDLALAKEAVRALGRWPNAAPAPHLLELARTSTDNSVCILALRGCIEVAGQEPNLAKRLATLQQAMAAAKRPDEKRQALGQIGQIPTAEALQVALANLADDNLADEAGLAVVSIAEKLAPANPKLADDAAAKVLAQSKTGDIAKRAWALRIKPSSAASFINEWVVCGPYRQAGIAGAEGVFNIPFGPEKAGEKVEWRSVPRADHINLAALFPGQDSCVAYLRTEILAPRECDGALLMGSDDGIKAWLNGEVVHSHNIDRGEVTDQDTAPIHLKKGTNHLMLKISQGGGGWSASARFIGADGKPIPGLLVERPVGAAAPVTTPAPKPVPAAKASILPKRDAFQKLRLSDQFYTEGAYFGDFNRDGKMDIVAGPFWFEGPDFQKRHEYRPVKAFDPKGYSDNFLTFTSDFNGDGWTDVLCVPFPGAEGYWHENPQGKDGPWPRHLAYANIGNESPVWGDVTGDGRPELIFCNDGYLGYAGPNSAKPEEPWVFHAISTKDKRYQRFTHGVGIGDINGDRRVDILEAAGWWEQPAEVKPDQPWIFHPFRFATDGAQMLVNDVDGDGLADVITAWHCHLYGLVWWQQVKGANGQPDWKQHVILSPTPDVSTTDFRVSQMHALELVDMNGDGLKDILTGKRFWAHGPTGDKEPDAPAVVFWLELRRDGNGGASFIPHLIDDDSGVGTQVTATDLDGDGRPDVIVGNKKGIFVQRSSGGGK